MNAELSRRVARVMLTTTVRDATLASDDFLTDFREAVSRAVSFDDLSIGHQNLIRDAESELEQR